jgi:hypothetical protein
VGEGSHLVDENGHVDHLVLTLFAQYGVTVRNWFACSALEQKA